MSVMRAAATTATAIKQRARSAYYKWFPARSLNPALGAHRSRYRGCPDLTVVRPRRCRLAELTWAVPRYEQVHDDGSARRDAIGVSGARRRAVRRALALSPCATGESERRSSVAR